MKKILLLAGLLFVTALLSGHEFWLHPNKFIYRVGENVNVKFLVGENYTGENWSGNRTRVKNLRLYYSNVTDDCANHLSETEKGDSLQLAFFEEGTMMLTFNNLNETNAIGREYYQRSVKTLIQVGEKLSNTYKKQTALPIDIIPGENPYGVRDGEDMKITVLFQKKPLANAAIKVWHRHNDQTIQTDLRTDEKGEAKFPIFSTGRWMVSAVKMTRLEKDTTADWQSYWGSLTWGYVR